MFTIRLAPAIISVFPLQAINDLMETQFLAELRYPSLPAVVEDALLLLEHPGPLPDVDAGMAAALEGTGLHPSPEQSLPK
jgi:hypothetical protein